MSNRVTAARAALVSAVRLYAPVHSSVTDDAKRALEHAMDELQKAAIAEAGVPGAAPPVPPGAQAGTDGRKPVSQGSPFNTENDGQTRDKEGRLLGADGQPVVNPPQEGTVAGAAPAVGVPAAEDPDVKAARARGAPDPAAAQPNPAAGKGRNK